MLLNQGIDESLFTELTADQAEMLEGGKRITILSVRCIQAHQGSDNLSFDINFERLGSPIFMQANSVANVGIGANFNGTANVRLNDNRSRVRIPLGGFSDSTVSSGSKTVRVNSGSSTYDVTYRIAN
jgi:hypothetical protein